MCVYVCVREGEERVPSWHGGEGVVKIHLLPTVAQVYLQVINAANTTRQSGLQLPCL